MTLRERLLKAQAETRELRAPVPAVERRDEHEPEWIRRARERKLPVKILSTSH